MQNIKINQRGAGVLMHITSLPSKFGCGDLGPEAIRFANFLHKSGQKFWQILPLGQTDPASSYSPYSVISSMAMNDRLISLEWLVDKGLLPSSIIKHYTIRTSRKVNFKKSDDVHSKLMADAFKNFISSSDRNLKSKFHKFCHLEKSWLLDFARYGVIKILKNNQPWFHWPEELKLRRPEALLKFDREYQDKIIEQQWKQFIVDLQWKELKRYCHSLDISIIGDLPFYVSHDSVDAWTHPDIFSLDKDGALTGMAGVPPDYFNADGQLWGMPVFRWRLLEKQGFDWWVQRIRKNKELYDIIRLDHFRAFAAYWEIPAGEKTAKNGSWKKGPGMNLFSEFRKRLGEIQFIAEDLGDIDKAVLKLRDENGFPGMKILQFAFGKDLPLSDYIPHNFKTANAIVYTGTHDNNTTKGWFRRNIRDEERKRISQYARLPVSEKNVHLELMRLAYESIANIAVIPMQDLLGLDEQNRMNTPSTNISNWGWRMLQGKLKPALTKMMKTHVLLYNR